MPIDPFDYMMYIKFLNKIIAASIAASVKRQLAQFSKLNRMLDSHQPRSHP